MRTTRRNLLKGGGKAVAAAAALPVIPNIAAGADQDAELLRLNAEYRALIAEQNAGKHRDESSDVTDESMERLNAIERKIADTPAETYAGIGIKLLIGIDNFDPLDPGETRTTDELNLESALADAERLAGEGIINSAQPKTAASDSELDAPLLRTDANYTALLAKCNAGESSPNGDISDLDQEWLTGLEEAIAAYPVHTLAGVAAKLHVVRAFIGREVPVRADERCAYAALEAVERLLDGPTTVAPVTAGEDPFEALAAEWAEQKAECERLAKAENEAGVTGADFPSDAAQERLGEIEKRISVTPTTTILGIATKLRAEVFAEVEYEFTTTENVIDKATTEGAMPLRFPAPPTGVNPTTIEVMLFGCDTETGEDVECRVTHKALMDRCGARGQTDSELLRAFGEHRAKIEDAARRKYAAGKITRESDRTVVRLGHEDI